jgi:hypothetical protein
MCGTPYDETGYDKCPDCQYDHRFIKLRKQHEVSTEDKSRKDEESWEGNA